MLHSCIPDRLAQEVQRRAEERERSSRRLAQVCFQLEPNQTNRQELIHVIAILEEYGNTF